MIVKFHCKCLTCQVTNRRQRHYCLTDFGLQLFNFSVYNKINELKAFIDQEEVDLLFLSESWERENETLDQLIELENHIVISNVYQRTGIGGRPAILVNSNKYHVQNLTNTLINVKWGVEAVWCVLTPKNVSKNSKIKKIACAAIYSKPRSKQKSDC